MRTVLVVFLLGALLRLPDREEDSSRSSVARKATARRANAVIPGRLNANDGNVLLVSCDEMTRDMSVNVTIEALKCGCGGSVLVVVRWINVALAGALVMLKGEVGIEVGALRVDGAAMTAGVFIISGGHIRCGGKWREFEASSEIWTGSSPLSLCGSN